LYLVGQYNAIQVTAYKISFIALLFEVRFNYSSDSSP
jgi:hypothetical protein